ncbi:MAG: ATP-binding protein [Steroidobacteraceae bacterium]|jgi:PAS domain S-box-containing protein|nr:ATP-binding protein [Steroidobacteraceae bacterium]
MERATLSSAWHGAWRRRLVIVAGLVCITLAASGYINARLAGIYEAGSVDSSALSRQQAAILALQPRSGAVAAAIDGLLRDGDGARAEARVARELSALHAGLARAGADLLGGGDAESRALLAGPLDDVGRAARGLHADAREALVHARRGDERGALRSLAAVNRRSHEVAGGLVRLQQAVQARQLALHAQRAGEAGPLRRFETALLVLAGLVAGLVLLSGRRVALALRLAEAETAVLAARRRESDERFAYAARGTLDGIWDYDLATGSAFYSERLLELLHLPVGATLDPQRFNALIHPEDLPRVEAARATARRERQPYSVEMRLALPSGEYRWFLARGQGKWDETGRLLRLVGSISDITARKAGEMRLAVSTARLAAETSRLAAFVEHAPAAIAMLDSGLRCVAASRRWMDTFMRGDREAAGQPFHELFTDIPDAWRTGLARVLQGEIVGADDERWRPAAGGPERRLRWEARPWHEQGNPQPGVLLFAQDITRDREHEAQLERMRDAADAANRAKSEFLATMSHEIRTPMNGVLGFTQLLLDSPLDAQQREFARTIDASGRSLLALLNDILDYSKIEAGKLQVDCARFDLRAVVGEVAALFSSQCREKRLELRVDVAADAPVEPLGDAARVRQVLTNLVGNAVKFTAAGQVRIEVRRDGCDGVAVSVSDTGIGIPAEALPGLFNKFVQVDSTTTRRFGGTGLGLAICRQLVELMHGTIGARSREGEGSTFWFRLPTPSILVVDDHPVSRSLALRVIGKLGHAADVAADGESAVELCSRRGYRLILMACRLPGIDGFAAATGIRAAEDQDPGRRPATIVALGTGLAGQDRARALAAGMQDFLCKPLAPADLQRVVDRWVEGTTAPPAAATPQPPPRLMVAN